MKFTKIHGAGNDFILIDDRAGSFSLSEEAIRSLCHRNFGVGADGVIVLQRDDGWRMRIFNSDGREAEGCGNGLRCLGRFLLHLGEEPKDTAIRVHDRTVVISYMKDKISVDMGEARELCLNIPTERGVVHFVDTGVPHVVHFVNQVQEQRLHELGPFWRWHTRFSPRGANVNLAAIEGGRIRVRTFERGVESETLACGTGACAVAVVASLLYSISTPMTISFPGGDLEIEMRKNRIQMRGPATIVFEGSLPSAG